jgi:hypothetical protein
MVRFIASYTFIQFGTAGNTALSLFCTLCSSPSSVFTSRILTTDLSESHCNFQSYVKSYFHRLISFWPFLLNHLRLPSPELDPIPYSIYSSSVPPNISYNHYALTPRKTPSSIVKSTCLVVRYITAQLPYLIMKMI